MTSDWTNNPHCGQHGTKRNDSYGTGVHPVGVLTPPRYSTPGCCGCVCNYVCIAIYCVLKKGK